MKHEIWSIRHKVTKKLWEAKSGKSSWKKAHHAKAAWANSHQYSATRLREAGIEPILEDGNGRMTRYGPLNYRFNDQDLYEVVLLETSDVISIKELDTAKGLLYKVLAEGYIAPKLTREIAEFLGV